MAKTSAATAASTPDPVAAIQELFRGLRALATVLRRIYPGRDADIAFDVVEDAVRCAAKRLGCDE